MTITPDQAMALFRANRPISTEEWNVSMPSRGLGDTVAKFTHATGLNKVARAYEKITGRPCGCNGRQQGLNKAVPYRFPEITTTHLIYHVYAAKGNEIWRANLRQLRKRWGAFSGRKIVAVVSSNEAHPFSTVAAELDDPTIEWIALPNDERLREVATFLPLLQRIKTTSPRDAVFYAHTKGNTSDARKNKSLQNGLGVEYWRNAMYHALLDDMDLVRQKLCEHPCVGTTIISWKSSQRPPYPSGLPHGQWMFAGTFFWFRASCVFGDYRWPFVPDDRWGAEAWLSGLFKAKQACSLYQPWPIEKYPTPSPYDPEQHSLKIRDEVAQ